MLKLFLPIVTAILLFGAINGVRRNHFEEDFDSNEFFREDNDQKNASKKGNNDDNKCQLFKDCFKDEDCGGGGGKGRCFGLFVGKCDCTPCQTGFVCDIGSSFHEGAKCGGLKGACNETSGVCSCELGYKEAGFANISSALLQFCSRADCNSKRDDRCHGLPCRSGKCICF